MNPLPLLSRELIVASRRPITLRLKLGFGGGSMIVAVWALLVSKGDAGTAVFLALSGIASVAAMFTGIFVASDTISRERREGTLGFLFLTDLHARDVVLGKLAAAGLVPAMALLAMVPALALCQLIGGVPAWFFWKTVLALVLTLFYSLSATIYVSSMCEDHRKAYSGSTILLLVANPLWMYFGALTFGAGKFALTLGIFVLLIALFLFSASARLAKTWRDSANYEPKKNRAFERRLSGGLLEKFPVAWMMLRRQRFNASVRYGGYAIAIALALACVPMASTPAGATRVLWVLLGIHVALQFILIARTAYSFYSDRQNGALELLLGSSLGNEEIFQGFNRFLFRKSAPTIALMTSIDLIYAFTIWENGASKWAALPLGLAGGLWITLGGLGWLGVYRSLMMKHPSLAMLATFARLSFVPLIMSLLFLQVRQTDQVKVAEFYVIASAFLAIFFAADAKAALAKHGRTLLLRPYTEKAPHIENEWSFIDWEEGKEPETAPA
jgi:hypothetical protein